MHFGIGATIAQGDNKPSVFVVWQKVLIELFCINFDVEHFSVLLEERMCNEMDLFFSIGDIDCKKFKLFIVFWTFDCESDPFFGFYNSAHKFGSSSWDCSIGRRGKMMS